MRKTARNTKKKKARENKAFTFSAILINERTVHGQFTSEAAEELIETITKNSGIQLTPLALERSIQYLTA